MQNTKERIAILEGTQAKLLEVVDSHVDHGQQSFSDLRRLQLSFSDHGQLKKTISGQGKGVQKTMSKLLLETVFEDPLRTSSAAGAPDPDWKPTGKPIDDQLETVPDY